MKKNEIKMILVLILIAILIIGIIYIATRTKKQDQNDENNIANSTENINKEEFVQVQEDGEKVNISNKLKEEKYINGLKINNVRLTHNNGQSVLLADVTNTTSTDLTDAFFVNIILLDKNGKEMHEVLGVITPIKSGETTTLNAGVEEDYANAYDFRIEKY